MQINVGNINLHDWQTVKVTDHSNTCDYVRSADTFKVYYYSDIKNGIVIYYNINNSYSVLFIGSVRYLRQFFEKFNTETFSSFEEAKIGIDNFLIKMSKLNIFI